jgi:exodeoxyribonuclease VII large subunit
VTASSSDGQRDFQTEITHNAKGYAFVVTEFLTQLQGDQASGLICRQLKLIEERKNEFDVVVIVRGGGSETDFKPFEDYELARCVASFPLPVLTGIGHDRNTSITDMMVRQHKTPTKVASSLVDHNYNFERVILDIKERLLVKAKNRIEHARANLHHIRRTVKAYSPETILSKGYAMIMHGDKIIVNPRELAENDQISTILKDEIIQSTITTKTKNGTDF